MRVSVIGSCRVYTPIERARASGLIEIGHEGSDWFTHSTKDTLQKIEIVNRRALLAEDMIPLVINERKKYKIERYRSNFYEGTDVFLIEICSIKLFKLHQLYLQQWCVRDALQREEGDRIRQLAAAAERSLMTSADIAQDLSEIRAKLGAPVLFVTHNRLPKPTGEVPAERLRILSAMEHGVPGHYFDPTDSIRHYGIEKAMKDPAHYTADFEAFLGVRIVEHLKRLL